MASNLHIAQTVRNAGVDAMVTSAALNSGFLDVYDGIQPATPETAVTTQVKLARLTLNAAAFAAAVAGIATAGAIASGTGLAASTATWGRILTSGGTAKIDGSVGTSAADFIINAAVIAIGATVSCSACTFGIGP